MRNSLHDVICAFVPGMTEIVIALWLSWVLIAPVVAGPIPAQRMPHVCPDIHVRHSVGSNLKTKAVIFDRCDPTIPSEWKY
jgi:hypothetical protein